MNYAIIVHGGLKKLASEEEELFENGCNAAMEAGWKLLETGSSARDAVEAAVRVLEDDPLFNAGLGSALNSEGKVEMDAAIMDGHCLRVGAVAAIRGVCHPVTVARRLMESEKAVMLAGVGAHRFAVTQFQELCPSDSLITESARQEWVESQGDVAPPRKDTVGCVALDQQGRIAAATSTGGLAGKLPGRVGDSPLVGCGLLADEYGGASLTGDGEYIIRSTLASRILGHLRGGSSAENAAEAAIRFMDERLPGEAGCIVIDRQGRIGFAHNSPNLACAFRTSSMPRGVALVRKEPAHA
jgi:L-asparaginase / beta-aspartyl-peptidase